MSSRRLGLAALSILSAVSGCGGSADASTSGAVGACSFSTPLPDVAKTAPVHASVEVQAEAAGRIALDAYLRPYLRGEIAVYRGTLEAHDNQGVLGAQPYGGPKLEDQSVPASSAVAALTVQEGSALLTVHSVTEGKYLTFQQPIPDATETTNIGIILSDDDTGGNTGTCERCVPAFGGDPASIAFAKIESSQLVGRTTGGTAHLHTYATANLERVPACSVTFADVAELNKPSALAFEARGGEMVSTTTGYGFTPTGCYETYTIDLYVNLENLADYGVRNFQPTSTCTP
jgi:hypothetical protein